MRAFNHSCQGESHKADDKVCQDASRAEVIQESGITVCIVSDGHGGEQYFRSQVGAKALVEITSNKVQEFASGMSELNLLKGQPFYQMGISAEKMGLDGGLKEIDARFMQLFRAIKAEWMIRIYDDAQKVPITEWENSHVKQAYLEQFKEQRSLEKIYGATLMAFVRTHDFWFAFHIGDGKMIMFDQSGIGKEPVLWDNDCFLNKTTSICQEDAVERFRYSFEGDGDFPVAVFLGSDGIDDTFTDGEPLYDFYKGLMQELSRNGDEAVQDYLRTNLPLLSARGSQDDMSVAYCYDEDKLNPVVTQITRNQVVRLEKEFKDMYFQAESKRSHINNFKEENKAALEEADGANAHMGELDSTITALTQEVNELSEKKAELEAEMERKIQAIRDEYKDRLAEFDESIQNKGTELTDANNKKAKLNSPENKAKRKLLIDLSYEKADLEKMEATLNSLVDKINKFKEYLGEDVTSRDSLIGTLIPNVVEEPAAPEMAKEDVEEETSAAEVTSPAANEEATEDAGHGCDASPADAEQELKDEGSNELAGKQLSVESTEKQEDEIPVPGNDESIPEATVPEEEGSDKKADIKEEQ